MIFRDEKHERLYYEFLSRLSLVECYQRAACYLMALDEELRKHPNDVFDFTDGSGGAIVPKGLDKGWQTGTSRRTTRLMFNLWNGFADDTEPVYYTSYHIFCSEYSDYYYEAIKLLFGRV